MGLLNCRVCGQSLFPGRAVFHCHCGALLHAHCWERHVLDSHRPPFIVGTVNLDGEFSPSKPGGAGESSPNTEQLPQRSRAEEDS